LTVLPQPETNGILTYLVYFPWPPLEAELSIYKFRVLFNHAKKLSFLFIRCLWSVDLRK